MKNCYFPKKSHHGYFDKTFQRTFYDKKQKLEFMNKAGFVEADGASKAHMKRVKDLTEHTKREREKNPHFKFKGDYPT